MNKCIKIILVFLVLLFSIGMVSATEENNLITEDAMEVEEINDLNLESVNEELSTKNAAGDVHNFTWLDNEIYKNGTNNATIDLEESTVKWNITDSLTDGIEINKTVTIKNGIIDGSNFVRIFQIISTGHLILHNISLVNGANVNGGAIYNGGILTIVNASFINNTAIGNDFFDGGGAIYNTDRGSVTINNSNFTDNTATNGGAIHNSGSGFSVSNSTFTSNTARYNGGGAIFNYYGSDFSVRNSKFNNNTARYDGGAIYNYCGSDFSVRNSKFNNNTARYDGGGAIHNYGGGLNVSYSIFYNNTVGATNETIYIDSGLVYLSTNFWGTNNPIFQNLITNQTTYTLNDFIRVELILDSPNHILNLNDDLFYHINISLNDTNNLDINKLPNTLVNLRNTTSIIEYFYAQNKSNVASGKTPITTDTSFELGLYYFDTLLNSVTYTLGSGYNYRWLNTTIYTSNGFIDLGGKTIKYDPLTDENFKSGIIINKTVNIFNGTIDGNNQRRIFNITNTGNLTLKNTTLTNGKANYGGAIYNNAGTLTINNSTFTNNNADEDGGAICNDGYCDVINSTFLSNNANVGGAIYSATTLNINNSTFKYNLAKSTFYGGGAICISTADNVYINDTVFEYNNATYGSAILNHKGNTILSNNTFKDNSLSHLIFNYENAILFLHNNTMHNDLNIEKIYNNGTITSTITLRIMNNATVIGTYNNSVILNASLTDDKNNTIVGQNITLTNNSLGNIILSDFEDGLYNFTYSSLSAGTFLINGSYAGGKNLTIQMGLLQINQIKTTLNITVDSNIMYNSNGLIYANVSTDNGILLDGIVDIWINGSFKRNIPIVEGIGNISISDIPAGNNYLINATFKPDNTNYTDATNITVYFNITKALTNLNINALSFYYGENGLVTALITTSNNKLINGSVNLDINGTPKTINILNGQGSVSISDMDAGNYYRILASFTPTETNNYLESSNINVMFNIYQNNVSMTVTNENMVYGENQTINITLNNDATELIILTINNKSINKTIINGNVIFADLNLTGGNHTIKIAYIGDNNYLSYNQTLNLTIVEVNTNISVYVFDTIFGDYPFIIINLTADNGDLLDVIVEGRITALGLNGTWTLFFNLENGTYTGYLSLNGVLLPANNYTIVLNYAGDGNYSSSNTSYDFNVYPANITIINVSTSGMVYNGNQTINITLNSTATGNVTIRYNGKNQTKEINYGKVLFSDLGLNTGEHNLTIIYSGDNNYLSYTETITVQIAKSDDNNLVLEDDEIVYSDNETITITVNPELTGTVTVIIGDETITDVPIINGTITIPELNLPAGNHSLEILYSGDSNFNSFNITVNLTVLKSNKTDIVVEDVNITANENQTLVIDIYPDATGNMTLTINGTDYIAPIINGTVIFPIDLNPGNYNGTIIYPGDDNFNGFNTTVNFNIFKSDVLLNSSDILMFYRDGTRYVAVLTDTLGNPIFNQTIYITVNGVTYKRETNINGTVYLNLNLLPKEYNITAYYNGSAKYNNASINTKLMINSTIITNDFVKYYRNETQYQVTVLDANGKALANQSVEFNINGMKYTRISDSNGIVTLSINLYPGNYTITTTYNGLNQSNNIEILSTLIGKDLNKNFGASEQYEVTVLDSTGKPLANQEVTINIHGVFYNCISDSNGIARLNINLNPGTYIATATWNGYSTSNNITVIS